MLHVVLKQSDWLDIHQLMIADVRIELRSISSSRNVLRSFHSVPPVAGYSLIDDVMIGDKRNERISWHHNYCEPNFIGVGGMEQMKEYKFPVT